LIPGPGQTYVYCGKVALFCKPASGGTFSSTEIEIIKWVKKIAVAQAKVTHILRPGKASEKTQKGVIPPSLCEILQNASKKNIYYAQQRKTNFFCFESHWQIDKCYSNYIALQIMLKS
jgi:hypothetical protein